MQVLVPTDFSTTAAFAFDAACQIAKNAKAQLHLYHAADIPAGWEKQSHIEHYQDEYNKAIAIAARDQLELLQAKAMEQGISCQIHYTGGRFVNYLKEMIERLQIDLVVMGSHGADKQPFFSMGSNAQKAIRRLDTSVLVVKKDVSKINFSKVMFASNLLIEDRKAFYHFLDLIAVFPVQEVHIVRVRSNSIFEAPEAVIESTLADFADMVEDYNCFTHEAKSFDVRHGIQNYAKQHGIHLIGISNHENHPIKHFLRGSYVEMLVNQSDIPVMSIDYETANKKVESA